MKSLFVILFLFVQVSSAQSFPTAELRFTPEFILSEVLKKKNLSLNPDIPQPVIFFESKTPLKKFQDSIESQWGFRPDVFVNAYAVKTNEIFLMDEKSYYESHKRCIDDSLAHEYVHYVQTQYQRSSLDDDSLESEAVDIQTWFRETHCKL